MSGTLEADDASLLRILMLEDDAKDVELNQRQLADLNRECSIAVVSSREQSLSAIADGSYDLILADNSIPGYGGIAALADAVSKCPDVPFIFVSGTLGEEQAIESLQAGATDYVLKERLSRLVPAVERALQERSERLERRAAEEQLRAAHFTMKTLIESSPIAVITLGLDRSIGAVWNPAAELIFGWSWEEVHGGPPPFIAPEDYPRFERLTQRVFAGASISGVELKRRRKDGRVVWVRLSAAPLRDEHGRVSGSVAFMADVTEEREAALQLQASEARFRTLFDNAPVAYFLTTAGGTLIDLNRRGEELARVPREEVLGINLLDSTIVPADRRDAFRERLERLCVDGGTDSVHTSIMRRDGTKVDVEIYACPITIEGKRVVLNTAVDVTERNELHAQLLHAQRMEAVGNLAGGVAHDFNNILTVIGGYVYLAKMSDALSEEIREHITSIEQAVQRAARLTQQLLLFSRKAPVTMARFDLSEAIQGTLNMLRHVIGEDIEIASELVCDRCEVYGDRTKLEQVLMNLVVNARDAMPDGGRLFIELASYRPEELASVLATHSDGATYTYIVRLTVADNGSGMDEETKAHLFEPFFTTKEREKGTGLGLSVVHGIVKEHRGWIEVESQPGAGSRFSVYLPQVSDEAPDAERIVADRPETPTKGARVLVVEDDDDIRASTERCLVGAGYGVHVAATVAAVRDLEEVSERFDIVVTDMVLPDGSGLDVAGLFGSEAEPRLIVVSGYVENRTDLKRIVRQNYRFLSKPYSPEALIDAIEHELAKD